KLNSFLRTFQIFLFEAIKGIKEPDDFHEKLFGIYLKLKLRLGEILPIGEIEAGFLVTDLAIQRDLKGKRNRFFCARSKFRDGKGFSKFRLEITWNSCLHFFDIREGKPDSGILQRDFFRTMIFYFKNTF